MIGIITIAKKKTFKMKFSFVVITLSLGCFFSYFFTAFDLKSIRTLSKSTLSEIRNGILLAAEIKKLNTNIDIIIGLCCWDCFIGFYWVFFIPSFFFFLFSFGWQYVLHCLSHCRRRRCRRIIQSFHHFHFRFYPILTYPFYCSIVSIERIDDATRSNNNKWTCSLTLILLY